MHAISQCRICIWALSDRCFNNIKSSAFNGDTNNLSNRLGVQAFSEHSVDHTFESFFWNLSLQTVKKLGVLAFKPVFAALCKFQWRQK